MNKNEMFRVFLNNSIVKERANLTEEQINNMNLFEPTNDPLIEVIKTGIMHLEDENISQVSRKINNYLNNL
ncbi:MAG: hypothetical protein ACOCQD_02875 [archaeon]